MILLPPLPHLVLSPYNTSCFSSLHGTPYLQKHIALPPTNCQHLELNNHMELGRIFPWLEASKLHIHQQIREIHLLNLQICPEDRHLLQSNYTSPQFSLNLSPRVSFQNFLVLHFKIQVLFPSKLWAPALTLFYPLFRLLLDFQRLMDLSLSYEQGWDWLLPLLMKEQTMILLCINFFQALWFLHFGLSQITFQNRGFSDYPIYQLYLVAMFLCSNPHKFQGFSQRTAKIYLYWLLRHWKHLLSPMISKEEVLCIYTLKNKQHQHLQNNR